MAKQTPEQPAFNPYKAPASEVMGMAAEDAGEAPFFPVGSFKFGVMSLLTLNLYLFYWFYKNWRCVQAREKVNVPIRTIFYPFTAYSFINRVRKRAGEAAIDPGPNAGVLAFLVLVLSIAGQAPDPFWLASLGTFLPLLPVQAVINECNQRVAPKVDSNERFSGANIAWMIVGAILYVLIAIGLSAPEQA